MLTMITITDNTPKPADTIMPTTTDQLPNKKRIVQKKIFTDAPSSAVRMRVMKRDKFQCTYCGVPGTDAELEVDHIIAKSKGGSHHMSNLTTCCRQCNQSKSDGPAPKKVIISASSMPVGMFVHILKNGQIHNQGHIIGEDQDGAFIQRFGWLTGCPSDVIYILKSKLYDENQCTMYSEREDMLEAWERSCKRSDAVFERQLKNQQSL